MSKREIKFRYWDGQEIHYVDLYFFEEHGIREWPADKNHYGAKELMQYTGLKDKSRREIYEGDILDLFERKHWIGRGEVWWCERDAGFVHGFQEVFDGELEDSYRPSKKFWASNRINVEVIGNIYENPELLEQ